MPFLILLITAITQTSAKAPDATELFGIWRGPSTCTDRQAADVGAFRLTEDHE